MGRVGAALIALAVLSGCGAAGQTAETPQQVVSTASQKMSQLHSAKFDFSATVLEQFPSSFTQMLGAQGAALSNLNIDLSGTGAASFPKDASMNMQIKTGSVSIATDVVVAGGQTYVKNPETNAFSQVAGGNSLAQFGSQTDPLSGAAILQTVQSIKDLGDTTINGTGVHHYQIIPDKNKLANQASTAQAQALLRSMLQSGSIHIEVWIGKADHLLYRLKDTTDASVDLNQALQVTGQQLPAGVSIPTGTSVHIAVDSTIAYHDFNAAVTVTAPPVSPS